MLTSGRTLFRSGETGHSPRSWLRRFRDAAVRTAPAGDDFVIDVQTDASLVARQWQELEPCGTAFQTRAWLLPWYRIVAPRFNASPLFVTVSHRTTGRAVMFFPLCLRRRHGLRIVEFADLGVSDYNAPIMAPGPELPAGAMASLWTEICRRLPPADIVRFTKMPETSSQSFVPLIGLDWMQRMDLRSWTLPLPQTRDEYDKTILKPKDRKEQRRKQRHLSEALGDVTFRTASAATGRREIFEALTRQRRNRFRDRGRWDILDDPTFFRFYETIALESRDGLAALSALRVADRPVATLFALVHNNSYCLLMHSFDLDLDRLSPGIVAIDEMITCAIESRLSCFDFTIGNEPYKRRFGTKSGFLYEGLYPLSWKGWVAAITKAAGRRVKATALRNGRMLQAGCKAGLNRIFEVRGPQGSP
jgi:CelD/BcsL family acetyltransferase involved in cellulose biosynthesis